MVDSAGEIIGSSLADDVTYNASPSEESVSSSQPVIAADLITAYLEQLDVEFVFGIPGGALEGFYNAVARAEQRGVLHSVLARHETSAAFMATGYARNSGKLGVCCGTTGPGATNMLTGVASAYENNTPLLIITPQPAQPKIGRKAMQESGDTGVNIVGIFQFCTQYNSLVSHVEQLEHKLVSAIMTALTPPYGPVHLSVPADVFMAPLEQASPSFDLRKLLRQPVLQDQAAVGDLCHELARAEKVVFVMGVGAGEASNLIVEVATMLNASIVATPDGKSFVSPYHPLFKGVIGFAGHMSAEDALRDPEVDLIVAIGATFGELTSNAWDESTLLNNRLIHIEQSEDNFTRSPMARLHVRGRAETIFESVIDELRQSGIETPDMFKHNERGHSIQKAKTDAADYADVMNFTLGDPRKIYDDSVPIKPQWLMHHLPKLFPYNTRYLSDTGNTLAWAIHYLNPFDRRVYQRRQSRRDHYDRRDKVNGLFQVAMEYCSMGWSVGNAIGAALANPNEPVVCVVGDASFQMYGMEMSVAVQEELSVIFLVMNDSQHGMVKQGQALNKAEDIANQLPPTNYAELASAMGVAGYRIETPEELLELNVDIICKRNGPSLLDIVIDPDEAAPMTTRIRGMK